MTWPPPNTRVVSIPYDHNAGRGVGVQHVQLAVTDARRPKPSDWRPAAFDIDHRRCARGTHSACQRVVWARFDVGEKGRVWVRDGSGERATRVRV